MNWKFDQYHKNLGGSTGAGKTYLANNVFHKQSDRISIFFNIKDDNQVSGKVVESVPELIQCLKKTDCVRYNYRPPGVKDIGYNQETLKRIEEGDLWKGVTEHANKLTAFAFELARKDYDLQICWDEYHTLAPSGSKSGPLHLIARQGRDKGIRGIFMSQRMAQASNDVWGQCKYQIWVGPPSPSEIPYFKQYGIDPQKVKEANSEHSYSVIAGGEIMETGKA